MTTVTKKYTVDRKNFVAFVHVTRMDEFSEQLILDEMEEALENVPGLTSITVKNGVDTELTVQKRSRKPVFGNDEKRHGKRKTWVPAHDSVDRYGHGIRVKGHYKWYPTKHKKHVSRKIAQPAEQPNGKTWITGSTYTKANGTRVTVPGHWRPLPAGYRARLRGPGVPDGTTVRHSLDA